MQNDIPRRSPPVAHSMFARQMLHTKISRKQLTVPSTSPVIFGESMINSVLAVCAHTCRKAQTSNQSSIESTAIGAGTAVHHRCDKSESSANFVYLHVVTATNARLSDAQEQVHIERLRDHFQCAINTLWHFVCTHYYTLHDTVAHTHTLDRLLRAGCWVRATQNGRGLQSVECVGCMLNK